MQIDVSDTAKIILYAFCGFIIAINLSLIFALRGRARDQAALRTRQKNTRKPWESKIDDQIAELAKTLHELNDSTPKPPGTS